MQRFRKKQAIYHKVHGRKQNRQEIIINKKSIYLLYYNKKYFCENLI